MRLSFFLPALALASLPGLSDIWETPQREELVAEAPEDLVEDNGQFALMSARRRELRDLSERRRGRWKIPKFKIPGMKFLKKVPCKKCKIKGQKKTTNKKKMLKNKKNLKKKAKEHDRADNDGDRNPDDHCFETARGCYSKPKNCGTEGGCQYPNCNDDGSECTCWMDGCDFPFSYQGETYFECTDKGTGPDGKSPAGYWCYTNRETKAWKRCECNNLHGDGNLLASMTCKYCEEEDICKKYKFLDAC